MYANLLVLKLKYSYFIIITICILKCYSFDPVGDYDYINYDCESLVFVQLHYFLNYIISQSL